MKIIGAGFRFWPNWNPFTRPIQVELYGFDFTDHKIGSTIYTKTI